MLGDAGGQRGVEHRPPRRHAGLVLLRAYGDINCFHHKLLTSAKCELQTTLSRLYHNEVKQTNTQFATCFKLYAFILLQLPECCICVRSFSLEPLHLVFFEVSSFQTLTTFCESLSNFAELPIFGRRKYRNSRTIAIRRI